ALFPLALLSGCAGLRPTVAERPAEVVVPPPGARGVLFCADGAGDSVGVTRAFQQGFARQGIPLHVERVRWSHGRGRILADQVDSCNVEVEGRRLAARVGAWRASCPGSPVYLVGHSAGCAVVLSAAESLPPGSVDTAVLLAPAVSADYDLRPTLACARRGVD